MLGVEDEIAVDQLRGVRARALAGQHPQRLAACPSELSGATGAFPSRIARLGGHDHRHLRA